MEDKDKVDPSLALEAGMTGAQDTLPKVDISEKGKQHLYPDTDVAQGHTRGDARQLLDRHAQQGFT